MTWRLIIDLLHFPNVWNLTIQEKNKILEIVIVSRWGAAMSGTNHRTVTENDDSLFLIVINCSFFQVSKLWIFKFIGKVYFYLRYRIQSVGRWNYFRQTSLITFWDESQTFKFILWILNFTVVPLHSQFDL